MQSLTPEIWAQYKYQAFYPERHPSGMAAPSKLNQILYHTFSQNSLF